MVFLISSGMTVKGHCKLYINTVSSQLRPTVIDNSYKPSYMLFMYFTIELKPVKL